jgi:hypothetical protein
VADDTPGAGIQQVSHSVTEHILNGVDTGISGFYDAFAANYHLLFEDWEASIVRQAAAIASILEREFLRLGLRSSIAHVASGRKRSGWRSLVSA